MKTAIDIGHNCNYDTGAISIFAREDVLNKKVGLKVIEILKNSGHTVINCEPYKPSSVLDSLNQRTSKAILMGAEIFCSIHFNKYGEASGTEVFAISEVSRKIAQSVLDNICSLGFKSRGVKDGSGLYVVNHTNNKMPSLLVECCFIDSASDMKRLNIDYIAQAICRGLLDVQSLISSGSNRHNDYNIENSTLSIQRNLNRLSILDKSGKLLVEDGVAGTLTKSSIIKFQQIVNITADGVVGENTNSCIDKILEKPTQSINIYNDTSTRYIQYRVDSAIDGVFGNQTRNKVMQYQTLKRLKSDGIVGSNTWKELIS